MVDKKVQEQLETLRKLAVDLGKDGHSDMGARVAMVHDMIKEVEEKETEAGS